jgi:hypothetical protein
LIDFDAASYYVQGDKQYLQEDTSDSARKCGGGTGIITALPWATPGSYLTLMSRKKLELHEKRRGTSGELNASSGRRQTGLSYARLQIKSGLGFFLVLHHHAITQNCLLTENNYQTSGNSDGV